MTLTKITINTVNTLLNPFYNTLHKQWNEWRDIPADRFEAEEGIISYDWNCAMFLNNLDEDALWINHEHLRHLLDTFGVDYQLAYDTYNDCYVLLSDLVME